MKIISSRGMADREIDTYILSRYICGCVSVRVRVRVFLASLFVPVLCHEGFFLYLFFV